MCFLQSSGRVARQYGASDRGRFDQLVLLALERETRSVCARRIRGA
jgi:hypothetical protein